MVTIIVISCLTPPDILQLRVAWQRPALLRKLCRDAIERHVPADWLEGQRQIEANERRILDAVPRMLEWGGVS